MNNNLQQSIDFIKSQLSKDFIFINVYPDVLRNLIDGLEAQQREIERLAQWECDDCGFRMSIDHTDADSDEYSCPHCQLIELGEEHTSMKMALEWINDYRESLPVSVETYQLADAFLMAEDKASYALSTLSKEVPA